MSRQERDDEHEEAARQRWAEARTLGDLGELTAQWLEGRLSLHPLYGDSPDPETADLVASLGSFNRNGYVTTFSQPGELVEDGAQRAAVEGMCTEEIASRIQTVSLNSELIVIAVPTVLDEWVEIPISLDGNKVNTIGTLGVGGLDALYPWPQFLAPSLIRVLVETWQVLVIDPRWGRNDLLWDRVAEALQTPGLRLEWVNHGGP